MFVSHAEEELMSLSGTANNSIILLFIFRYFYTYILLLVHRLLTDTVWNSYILYRWQQTKTYLACSVEINETVYKLSRYWLSATKCWTGIRSRLAPPPPSCYLEVNPFVSAARGRTGWSSRPSWSQILRSDHSAYCYRNTVRRQLKDSCAWAGGRRRGSSQEVWSLFLWSRHIQNDEIMKKGYTCFPAPGNLEIAQEHYFSYLIWDKKSLCYVKVLCTQTTR